MANKLQIIYDLALVFFKTLGFLAIVFGLAAFVCNWLDKRDPY